MEIQTYCEGCGNTFAARYDQQRQCLVLECQRCGYTEISIAARDFSTLPESQQRTLHRLAERTAERTGETVPSMLFSSTDPAATMPPVFYPLKFTPLHEETQANALTAKMLDLEPLMKSMEAFNAMLKDAMRAFVNACGLPGAEPGKPLEPSKLVPRTPAVGKVHKFKPITTMVPPLYMPPANFHFGPPLKINAEAAARLMNAQPINGRLLAEASEAELVKKIELLRRIRHEAY